MVEKGQNKRGSTEKMKDSEDLALQQTARPSAAAATKEQTSTNRRSADAQPFDKGKVKGLFEQHYNSLVGFLYKKLSNEQEAQDVAQEAFARLLGLGDDKVINHMQAYLFRVANNLAIDRLRQKKRQQQISQELVQDEEDLLIAPPFESGLENEADARQRLVIVQQALATLPPKCRMAFMLYKFEGLTYLEVSHRMNLSESMVRKYVLRAIRYCAEQIAHNQDGEL